MLAFERGELPEAEAQLTGLIEEVEATADSRMRIELYHLYQDRATLRRRANRWDDALIDIEAAERLLPSLPRLMQRLAPTAIAHARAKIFASEFNPGGDAAEAIRQIRGLRRAGGLDFAADELESQLAFRTGDWPRATRLALSAAESLMGQGWRGAAATCRRRAAEALIEDGDLEAAEAQLSRAKEHIDQFGTPVDVARTELAHARLLAARSLHDDAWSALLKALEQFDALIHCFSSLADQQRFLIDKLDCYDEGFRIALAGGGERGCLRAWSIAERSKSFYLCQLVASGDISLFHDVDPATLRALHEIELEMDRLELSRAALSCSDREGDTGRELARRLREVSARKRSQLEELMRHHPHWGRVAVPSRLDIAGEVAKLPGAWIPLSYYWERPRECAGDASRRLHIFWMDRSNRPRHACTTWSKDRLDALETRRAAMCGTVPWGASLLPADLSDLILPLQVHETFPSGSRLLISPHDLLQQVPLHALPVGTANGDRSFLAGMWPVLYLPSLALLPLANHSPTPHEVLLIGCEQDGFNNGPLPDVEDEIEALHEIWSAPDDRTVMRRLIPTTASPRSEDVDVETWGDYGIIHVACHGVFPASRPFDASLLLGSATIRASELFRTRTNVRMASFSACSLGRQAESTEERRVVGDEWIGLYLPLLYGGARCVVASLWNAYSGPAAQFMLHLHTAVKRGDEPADAVRWAQDRTANEIAGAPPATWANWYPVGFPTGSRIAEEIAP
jgi:tetratricopeptide (TPR) repeat protein